MMLLETADLQQLAQKATGPWKQLSKEEVVKRKRFFIIGALLCTVVSNFSSLNVLHSN